MLVVKLTFQLMPNTNTIKKCDQKPLHQVQAIKKKTKQKQIREMKSNHTNEVLLASSSCLFYLLWDMQ
jgi:hypothetical protein